MTRRAALILALALAGPAGAQDFSEGSEATSWNLYAEVPARFEARVVDILCELSGDCPEGCGGGARQLGLLRAADGVLVLATKNAEAAFSGAAADLLPFCGADVVVDGLMIDDPEIGARNVYLLQTITPAEGGETVPAKGWTAAWAEAHPEAAGPGPWFRRDPRVRAAIEAEGWFGRGPQADRAALEELFR